MRSQVGISNRCLCLMNIFAGNIQADAQAEAGSSQDMSLSITT